MIRKKTKRNKLWYRKIAKLRDRTSQSQKRLKFLKIAHQKKLRYFETSFVGRRKFSQHTNHYLRWRSTWRRQIDSGEAGLAKHFFNVQFFNPHAKSCPKSISEAYKITRMSTHWKINKKSGYGAQQLCSTLFGVYCRSSTRLYRSHPVTSREFKQKTERITLWHIKLYKN